MFTGVVTEVGKVTVIQPVGNAAGGALRMTVEAPRTIVDADVGDSIAVNGVCLTATEIGTDGFTCEAVQETVERSTLGDLATRSSVNLERPMAADGRFDGHIVQGHVDGVGAVVAISPEGTSKRFRIELPAALNRYVVEKGSIAVDGTSLTVTAVSRHDEKTAWFEFVAIPHTLANTVLGDRHVGDRTNLEMDVFAKYVERIMETSR